MRKVSVDLTIEGMVDDRTLAMEAMMALHQGSRGLGRSAYKIMKNLRVSGRHQIRSKHFRSLQTNSMESYISMIDKWSIFHGGIVVLVTVVQVYFLRGLFNVEIKGGATRIDKRA